MCGATLRALTRSAQFMGCAAALAAAAAAAARNSRRRRRRRRRRQCVLCQRPHGHGHRADARGLGLGPAAQSARLHLAAAQAGDRARRVPRHELAAHAQSDYFAPRSQAGQPADRQGLERQGLRLWPLDRRRARQNVGGRGRYSGALPSANACSRVRFGSLCAARA